VSLKIIEFKYIQVSNLFVTSFTKAAWRTAKLSPPHTVEFKNEWSYTSNPTRQ